MKLNTAHLRYLTPEDWKVLTAVENGSKNHEIVPTSLIIQLSHLRSGSGAQRSISTLAKANLIARVQNAKYDGYRLTYGGLDYLALHTHFQRKTLHSTGQCIGTGKESDIHIVLAPPTIGTPSSDPLHQASHHHHQQQCILKIHRLGRISFRTIKTNRDYLRHRTSASWMQMSHLSARKEFAFMSALHAAGFPVPTPLAWNRHTVVMSLIEGTPLYQIRHLQAQEARGLYAELMAMIVRLACVGLIHGDFNEFNIMIEERIHASTTADARTEGPESQEEGAEEEEEEEEEEEKEQADNQQTTSKITLHPILIDFPQMLSISHPNASTYFDRDVNCVKRYFSRRFHFTSDDPGPFFQDVEMQPKRNTGLRRLDVEVEASGFSKRMAKELEKYMDDVGVDIVGSRDGSASDTNEDLASPDDGPPKLHAGGDDPEDSSGHGDLAGRDSGGYQAPLATNEEGVNEASKYENPTALLGKTPF